MLMKENGSHVNLLPISPTAGRFKTPTMNNVPSLDRILSNAGVNCTVRVEKRTEI